MLFSVSVLFFMTQLCFVLVSLCRNSLEILENCTSLHKLVCFYIICNLSMFCDLEGCSLKWKIPLGRMVIGFVSIVDICRLIVHFCLKFNVFLVSSEFQFITRDSFEAICIPNGRKHLCLLLLESSFILEKLFIFYV